MEETLIGLIRERRKGKLMDMFRKYGYNTQGAIVSALQNKGYYQESNHSTIRVYLSQIFNGNREPSHKLLEG